MNALTRTLDHAGKLASQTPPDRNRAVDFLRAVSILVVVFGHWLMAAPEMIDGQLRINRLVADTTWAQWATWILQVMPIFFFVGGYSNAMAWRSARSRNTPQPVWLRDRLRRLILPAVPVLLFWVPVAALALVANVPGETVRLASQAALVPTWFLAAYVVIVATVPFTLRLWERFGWAAFVGTAVIAGATDVASIGLDIGAAAWLNYIFVWNAVHMLGYAWADDRIGGLRSRLAFAGAGLAALATLVLAGPYPIAMVGLDNAELTNSNPPKVTLVALAVFQFGLAMAAERPIRRWLARTRPWTAVVAVNGSIMSLYLWHLTVFVALTGALMGIGGIGLGIPVGSGMWWITRIPWLGLLLLLTLPVVGLVARFERPDPDRRPSPMVWQPIVAVVGVCAGLGLTARNGIADAEGVNTLAITLALGGLALGGVFKSPRRT